jgi:hypothetical protein
MPYSGLLTRCIQLGLNRAHTSPTRQRGESRRRSPRWRVGLTESAPSLLGLAGSGRLVRPVKEFAG